MRRGLLGDRGLWRGLIGRRDLSGRDRIVYCGRHDLGGLRGAVGLMMRTVELVLLELMSLTQGSGSAIAAD